MELTSYSGQNVRLGGGVGRQLPGIVYYFTEKTCRLRSGGTSSEKT